MDNVLIVSKTSNGRETFLGGVNLNTKTIQLVSSSALVMLAIRIQMTYR